MGEVTIGVVSLNNTFCNLAPCNLEWSKVKGEKHLREKWHIKKAQKWEKLGVFKDYGIVHYDVVDEIEQNKMLSIKPDISAEAGRYNALNVKLRHACYVTLGKQKTLERLKARKWYKSSIFLAKISHYMQKYSLACREILPLETFWLTKSFTIIFCLYKVSKFHVVYNTGLGV